MLKLFTYNSLLVQASECVHFTLKKDVEREWMNL